MPPDLSVLTALPVQRREPLKVVSAWDLTIPYQEFRAQHLMPPALAAQLPDRPTRHRTYIVVNQKGGAGKTTTTMELAAVWTAMGYTVRVIDSDHQASLSGWLQPLYPEDVAPKDRRELTDVFYGRCSLDEATYYTRYQNLYVVPSTEELALVDLDPRVGKDTALRKAIAASQAPIDITIIDAPPALGKLSVNGLTAADEALVPLKVGALDERGLGKLHRTIRAVQEETNPGLVVRATFLTAWKRSEYAREVAERVRADYPEAAVFTIRESVKAAEAPKHFEPVRLFEPTGTTAADYDQAGRMLLHPKEDTA
ncbi:ParA family protein [Kitasatospora cathayae]|uniref:AAA family ATPase n=1 Tax=Kitasatospora cathayae TaxID=3004092 RepID=A0ABY7QHE4_9ACTN|nr:AAA family ATPase [Kitasatospora sp. HUAS 3-15]WBP92213.1 AAA family ATPase [Kitasatospora sp. HUAS 3-15]